MAKKIVLAAVVALLAAPMAAAEERPAPADKAGKEKRATERQPRKIELKQATRHCAELKQQIGRAAFEATYPTFRACVLARVQAERANRSEAKADCLAKLDKAKLGKRAKAKRLAACTAKTAAADSALEREAVVNAAKACAEELAADPAAFRAEYGKSRNLAHAFGKCVAAKAKAGGEDESGDAGDEEEEEAEDADDEDLDEPGDDEVIEDEDEDEGDEE